MTAAATTNNFRLNDLNEIISVYSPRSPLPDQDSRSEKECEIKCSSNCPGFARSQKTMVQRSGEFGAERAPPSRLHRIQFLLETFPGNALSGWLRRLAGMSGLSAERTASSPQASQKVETVEFICHPLHSNCTAPLEVRPPPEGSECLRFLTKGVRRAVDFWLSENV